MNLRPLPISIYSILLIGVGVGFLLAIRIYIPFVYWGEVDDYTWTRYALPSIILYTLWPFFIPFAYHNSYKWQFGLKYGAASNIKAVVYAIFLCAFLELLSKLAYFGPLELLGWFHIDEKTARGLKVGIPANVINRCIEYVIFVGGLRALDNYRTLKESELRMERIQSQLTSAKLKALRMQLQPHFLFNTLNSISSLLDIDISKARTVIAQFGDVLRNILDASERSFVPLGKEIENTKKYLSIEEIRFSDRLNVIYDIPEDCTDVSVPSFVLQPLVENVIKHGLANTPDDLKVVISAGLIANVLRLTVHDNGAVDDFTKDFFHLGVGLKNTRERLQNLFGNEGGLDIIADQDGFKAIVLIPVSED